MGVLIKNGGDSVGRWSGGGGGLQNIILNIQEVVGYIPNSQQNIEMYFLIEYKMPFLRMENW